MTERELIELLKAPEVHRAIVGMVAADLRRALNARLDEVNRNLQESAGGGAPIRLGQDSQAGLSQAR